MEELSAQETYIKKLKSKVIKMKALINYDRSSEIRR